MKILKKTFIVTGAGNGIGRELVLILLSKRARVLALIISKTEINIQYKIIVSVLLPSSL